MVSPRTRGMRGRGTLLKNRAKKQLSGGVIAIICALFTIGITLEGLSLSMIGQSPFNILSVISLIGGTTAIIGGIKLWSQGRRLQNYRKPKKPITQKFKIRGRLKSKSKTKSKTKSKNKSKTKSKNKSKNKSKQQ